MEYQRGGYYDTAPPIPQRPNPPPPPPPPPPGCAPPQPPNTNTNTTWRESSFISSYGDEQPYQPEPRPFVSNSGVVFQPPNHNSVNSYSSSITPVYPTYVNPTTSNSTGQTIQGRTRSNSGYRPPDKRPLNPPPVPYQPPSSSSYYNQPSNPPVPPSSSNHSYTNYQPQSSMNEPSQWNEHEGGGGGGYGQPEPPRQARYDNTRTSIDSEAGGRSNSSREAYSIYSYHSNDSNSTTNRYSYGNDNGRSIGTTVESSGGQPYVDTATQGYSNGYDGSGTRTVPDRKQSLGNLRYQNSMREQEAYRSGGGAARYGSGGSGGGSSYPSRVPEEAIDPYQPLPSTATTSNPRQRQPTILMSPPLDNGLPSSPSASYPSYASPNPSTSSSYQSPASSSSYHNNNNIERYEGLGRQSSVTTIESPSSYSRAGSFSSSFLPGGGGQGRASSPSTLQTSPAPSPSLSAHSPSLYSIEGGPGGPSRKASQATLSPLSSGFRSFSNSFANAQTTSNETYPTTYSPYSDSYSFLSPSPSTRDLFPPSNSSPTPTSALDGDSSDEVDERRYLNPAFLSHIATYLKDHVPRGEKSKGNSDVLHWGFTGMEIVDTILEIIPTRSKNGENSEDADLLAPPTSSPSLIPSPSSPNSYLPTTPRPAPSESLPPPPLPSSSSDPETRRRRSLALSIARTLHQSLWFLEVDFDDSRLNDSMNQVFTFLGSPNSPTTAAGNEEGPNASSSLSRGRIDHQGRDVQGGGGGGMGMGEEVPTGVVTELTRCYSPFCTTSSDGISRGEAMYGVQGVKGGCYSYTCPNRKKSELQRVSSSISTHSGQIEAPLEEAENWASSVPKSILDSLDKREIAYQNQIFELIQGEQKYLDDLNFIETGFVEPLRTANPPIVAPHRIPHFLSSILLNISDIRQHSERFLASLRAKQSESIVIRGGIGKIVLTNAVEWGSAYIKYTVGFPMADWLFKEEKESNPRFNDLLMDFHKRPEASKRGFDTFHNRATFRGLRYILLLEQILKNAPEDTASDRQDREYLEEAIKVIRQQGKEADVGIGETKGRVSLREFERGLVRKQGDLHDLELLDESRKFFMAGKVYRRPEASGFTDQFQEAHLVLFDNYLVTTKAPRMDRDGKQRYLISRRPVPLDLIQLKASSFSESPVPRSSGFHLRSNRSAGSPQPSAPASAYASQDSSLLYPISFFQMGRFDGLVYLYVDTPAQRLEWEKKLKEAIALRTQRSEANRVVRLEPLADATFGTTSSIGSLHTGPSNGTNQFGRPTCSTPLQTIDGLWLIIAGCQEGIFIGWRGRPQSMQQVVHLAGITQCAVLPDFSFLLVVANKVLVAYALEALIPTKTISKLDQASKAPQRLSGQKDVSFFRVGKVGDSTDARTLVIYAKKSGVKESVFKALEPVSQNDRAKGGSSGHRFLGFGTGRPEWFRVHKEFFMPSLVTSLQFQRSKLALIGSRGVEIMDLESMRTMTVPDFPSVRHNRNFAALAKRCEEVPTMGMFRIADSKFLLVYTDFAFHVGRHGEPIEGPLIEWESKPEQVAFCFPYIFAISPTIIEIRNAFTGRLAQFITGSHIFLTFDGSAIPSSQSSGRDMHSTRASSLSSASNSISNVEADTPVEKLLHVSMRTGSFHVLYEISIVA